MPQFAWDEAKRRANLAKHGLDFAELADLDWDAATIVEDTRRDYGERRYWAFVTVDGRLRIAAFARREDVVRVISYRRANTKEINRHAFRQTKPD